MKRVCIAILVLAMSAIPTAVRADVAPPGRPPGANLEPGEEITQVRMAAETVIIDVQPGAPIGTLGQARVKASFSMRNMGTTDESMAVRFPLGADDGWSQVREIAGIAVRVDGRQVPTHRILSKDPGWSSTQVPWATFDVTFPAGQDVAIDVQYMLEAGGEYPFSSFKYILETGAGWKGTIGTADIIVQLPYAAGIENVLMSSPGIDSGTTPGGALDGNSIRWHYNELEPVRSDNFEVNLVAPPAWQQFLAEQKNIAQHPADGEAWGRIGKLCKQMAFSSRGKGFRLGNMDPGGAALYERSLQAYDKAVTLLPRDGQWHAGYADLLSYHAYFAAFSGEDTRQEALHSLQEIQSALALAPTDAKVKQIAEQISYMFPDGMRGHADQYDYPWLTATPAREEPTPSVPPTAEVAQVAPTSAGMTATPAPASQPAPAAKPSTPICGSLGLVPLAALVFSFSALKRKPRR